MCGTTPPSQGPSSHHQPHPKSATGAVLPLLCAWGGCLGPPLPSCSSSLLGQHPLCAGGARGGHLQQLLLLLPLLQGRGASPVPWSLTGCRGRGATPCSTPGPCAPLPGALTVPTQLFTARPRAQGRWWQLWAGGGWGHTLTHKARECCTRTDWDGGRRGAGVIPAAGAPGVLLAHALVGVDVGLAVGTRVCHVLEVIEQAGDQAAAEITPGEGKRRML